MSNDPSAIFFAVLVVLVLGLVLRWVFKPSRPRTGTRALRNASESLADGSLGMLDVVLPDVPRSRGLQLRNTLAQAGIRSSVSSRRDGHVDLLVFRDDAARARAVLSLDAA